MAQSQIVGHPHVLATRSSTHLWPFRRHREAIVEQLQNHIIHISSRYIHIYLILLAAGSDVDRCPGQACKK